MKKLMLGFALVLSACAATIPNSQQVAIRAGHDFKCDADKVQTTPIDARTYRASACGQEAVYEQQCTSANVTRCNWVSRGGSAGAPTAGSGGAAQ